VEIEFAVQLSENEKDKHEFNLLQIRPMSILSAEFSDFKLETLPGPEHAIVSSRRVLGLGKFSSNDIVYVRESTFNVEVTEAIAREIAELNKAMSKQGRNYVLITKGRLGAGNKKLGIPVNWEDISKVSCIVETALSKSETQAPPSEGSHFFHNLTSLGIGFLTVYSPEDGHVAYDWLESQPAAFEGSFIRHIKFEDSLEAIADAVSQTSVIMKPGQTVASMMQADAFLQQMNDKDVSQYSKL